MMCQGRSLRRLSSDGSCVEQPAEDITSSDRAADNVGHLQRSLYGTRDAAMNWQEEVAREMKKRGFKRGRYNPCLYWRESDDVLMMVHGDDVVSVGTQPGTRRFKEELASRFEIKTQVSGPDPSASSSRTVAHREGQDDIIQEGRVLNRVIRRTEGGWDIIVHELGLQESKPVSTPGEVKCRHEDD